MRGGEDLSRHSHGGTFPPGVHPEAGVRCYCKLAFCTDGYGGTEMVCLKSSRCLNFFEIFIKFFIGDDHSP